MIKVNRLTGMDIVMNNLKKQMEQYKIKGIAGMLRAVAYMREDMERTSPKIPVDTNNLRASWFVVSQRSDVNSSPTFKGDNAAELQALHSKTTAMARQIVKGHHTPLVVFGFSANYAWYVHEDVSKNYKRSGSGAKFLEATLNRNTDTMLKIMSNTMKV